MDSPYDGLPSDRWIAKTEELIKQHPLKVDLIREVAISSWGTLWMTKVGQGESAFTLEEIEVPSTIIGYFFEKLFARELAANLPGEWRGGQSKDEKDLVCLFEPRFSIEMKTSGQLGTKIFGNRSYGQKVDEAFASKPERSGYYITVNYHGKVLTLVRFGWIDGSDWVPQRSATGQAASLKPEVYKYKLIPIQGEYRLSAPVGLLEGVGRKTAEGLAGEGINTLYDLLNYVGGDRQILKLRERAREQFVSTSQYE